MLTLAFLYSPIYGQKCENFEALTCIQYNEEGGDTVKLDQSFTLDISYSNESKIFIIENYHLTVIRKIKYDRAESEFIEEFDSQRSIQSGIDDEEIIITPPSEANGFWLVSFTNEEFVNNCDCERKFFARTYLCKRKANY